MYKNKKAIRVIAILLAVLMVLGIAVIAIEALAEDGVVLTETVQENIVGGEELSAETLPAPIAQEEAENPSGEFSSDGTPTDTPTDIPTEAPADTPIDMPEDTPVEDTENTPEEVPVLDVTALLPHIDDVELPIRVGIYYIYGSNNCLAFSHNLGGEEGVALYAKYQGEHVFYELTDKKVTIMRDFSAKQDSSGLYYHTTNGNTHIIYHCITEAPVPHHKLEETMNNYKSILGQNTPVFPLYIKGEAYIAVGTYANKDASAADCENMKNLLGVNFVPRVPNNTSLSVVETNGGKILFKIDTTDQPLLVRPLQDGEGVRYIKTAVGNTYDGTFEYKATIDGMYLVNILDLQDYIKSVLPYEIMASWPDECLKAFSIVVRSYTLSMLGRSHKNQDFDMCDETHCQAYRGRNRSTVRTDAAVDATKDTVLAYDSEICQTFYHAISGGVTESCEFVWGGTEYPYLVSQEVPEEKYWNYTNGIWKFEVSEKELFEYVQNNSTVKKYVKAPIKSIRVSKYTDAGYAYELEIIDESGVVSTFTKCDNIRSILTKYAKSPYLTIGKSADITVNNGEVMTIDPYNIVSTDANGNPCVTTLAIASGDAPLVISGEGEIAPLDFDPSDNYIISGKGWGHGVGLSQYGAKDMAESGYTWQEIARFFFPGAYLANLSDLSRDIESGDSQNDNEVSEDTEDAEVTGVAEDNVTPEGNENDDEPAKEDALQRVPALPSIN